MTKEELQQKADAYMESLRGKTPFYDWDVKKAYMDGLMEGEKECKPVQDAKGEMLVKLDTKELQELVEKAKDEALAELRKEFGWHPYPDEKPEQGDRVCICIGGKSYEAREYSLTFGPGAGEIVASAYIPPFEKGVKR